MRGVTDERQTAGSASVDFEGCNNDISYIGFIGVFKGISAPEPSILSLPGFGLGAVSLISRGFKEIYFIVWYTLKLPAV